MIGKTFSHYQIVGRLGAGGMGIVYEARDDRLGRSVALKFVPDSVEEDETTLHRLRAEARTASLLSHPNICTVYDIDESEGRPFIVMELLRGESLRERLVTRRLRIHEVVELAIQTADALDYAHANGVLHRDIKPANLILIARGQVKIVDFGLAKLLQTQDSSGTRGLDLTASGVTPGTVSYMSPEQISAHELDGRSDIFSFGVVLYECATGQKPFTGQPLVVLAAILNQTPPAPGTLNADIPPRLQDLLLKCLEKDRELRYQSAADLRADLLRVKRDLESGRLNLSGIDQSSGSPSFATMASVSQAPVVSQGAPPIAVASDSTPSSVPKRAPAPAALAVIGLAIVAIMGAGGWYFLVRRVETVSSPTAPATSRAIAATASDGRAAAKARLEAGDYRGALSQAENLLRATPGDAEAVRIRDQARATLVRFDEAAARARAAFNAGDFAVAASAIDTARSIDPASPLVAELSSQLIAGLRTRANAPLPSPAARGNVPSPEPPVPVVRAPVESARAPEPSVPATGAASEAQIAPRPAPPVATVPVTPPPTRAPEPAPAPPPAVAQVPTPPAEDDEAAIRRAIATYVRAIESKDVALFRSIKPNTSPEEQRRIEDGFRAVSSQRVAVRVLGIERRGAEALVRLRRADTIDAGGRTRTTETEQTMTLTRGATGWVIRDIGR